MNNNNDDNQKKIQLWEEISKGDSIVKQVRG